MEHNKPHRLIIAGRLMWTLWALGCIYAMWGVVALVRQSAPGVAGLASIYVVVLVLLALLIRFVLRGRKWALVVYSLFACIGILAIVSSLVLEPQSTALGRMFSIALVIAYGTILWCLFHPSVRSWRHDQSGPNKPLQATREDARA